jgi:hypothetical protein
LIISGSGSGGVFFVCSPSFYGKVLMKRKEKIFRRNAAAGVGHCGMVRDWRAS